MIAATIFLDHKTARRATLTVCFGKKIVDELFTCDRTRNKGMVVETAPRTRFARTRRVGAPAREKKREWKRGRNLDYARIGMLAAMITPGVVGGCLD
jgi:hypothetical protein